MLLLVLTTFVFTGIQWERHVELAPVSIRLGLSKDYLELNLVHLAGEGAIHWANGWWRWISRLHALVKK